MMGTPFAGRVGSPASVVTAQVRQGDAAPMAVISLLGEEETIKPAPQRPTLVASK